MNPHLRQALLSHAQAAAQAGLRRMPPAIAAGAGIRYTLGERPLVSFCSNDYLGLIADPPSDLAHSLVPAAGVGASRLVCGDVPILRRAEQAFATALGYEDAILLPSGYQANVGVLAALARLMPDFASDAFNHASLIDGLRLGKAHPEIVAHGQMPTRKPAGTWWILESTYSMDGDHPDPAAVDRWQQAGGLVYADEGHSFALSGNFLTFFAAHGLQPEVMCVPLGKAAASAGACIVADRDICDYLRGTCRSFVFSTGVHPALAQRLLDVLRYLGSDDADDRRQRLLDNIDRMQHEIEGLLSPSVPATRRTYPSPIFPILIGDNHRALQLSERLLARGWHVQAIRPPTVPAGTARLRLTLSAMHHADDIRRFAADLRRAWSELR